MQATLVVVSKKLVHFNAKQSKIEMSYIQEQLTGMSAQRDKAAHFI